MNVFILNCRNPEPVNSVNQMQEFDFGGLTSERNNINIGDTVFFWFGGEAATVAWGPGLKGFGRITSLPVGEGIPQGRTIENFKIKIKPLHILPNTVPRRVSATHERYRSVFFDHVPLLGGSTPTNQAIKRIGEEGVVPTCNFYLENSSGTEGATKELAELGLIEDKIKDSVLSVCRFCGEYRTRRDLGQGPYNITDGPAQECYESLKILKDKILEPLQSLTQLELRSKASHGQFGIFPYVVWCSLGERGYTTSRGFYLAVCFDHSGRGLVAGLARAVSDSGNIPFDTVNRTDHQPLKIDVDTPSGHASQAFNNAFYNPKEFKTEDFDSDKFIEHLRESFKKYKEILGEQNPEEILGDLIGKLKLFRQVILQGPPGTGKTYRAKRLAAQMLGIHEDSVGEEEEQSTGKFHDAFFSRKKETAAGHWAIVQFHPSYNYEDFSRGMQISVDPVTKNPQYEIINKIFGELAQEACGNPDKKYILIIDEMNRANLSSVLGELIYGLEYRGSAVETPYELPDADIGRTMRIPKNLFIIGTMNTADRSIGHIDYAVRRRFAFVQCLPDEEAITSYDYENQDSREKALGLFLKVKAAVSENLSKEFSEDDIQIGHTYFLAKTKLELKLKFICQVYPLLKEYLKDGILVGEPKIGDISILDTITDDQLEKGFEELWSN